jgi:hypothetical protein
MLRWWDGAQWTEHRTDDPAAPASAVGAPQQPDAAPYTGPTQTSGWAIAAVVFGIFAGVVGIFCGIMAKDRIRKSGGRLTGDGLATAGIVLGSVSVVLAIATLVIATSGSDNNASRYQGAERPIAALIDHVETAFDDNHGDEACASFFSRRFAANVARGSGQNCGDFVDSAVDSGQFQANIKIKQITIRGQTASVKVSEGGDPEVWSLVFEAGSWRVDAITSK